MKDDRSKHLNRPFKDLATLLKRRNVHPASEKPRFPEAARNMPAASPREETELFLKAMADVTPIACNHPRKKFLPRPLMQPPTSVSEDLETVVALEKLVRHGHGFIVAQTPEYMASANPGAGNEVLRRLHNGHYAIQDHVDLHGLSAAEAEPVLEHFLRRSSARGYRAVLVVHGRGLTSPGKPVLKHKVLNWLTVGPLRKRVIALTSARSCDGGAGATYVLLRSRPATKAQLKKMRPSN